MYDQAADLVSRPEGLELVAGCYKNLFRQSSAVEAVEGIHESPPLETVLCFKSVRIKDVSGVDQDSAEVEHVAHLLHVADRALAGRQRELDDELDVDEEILNGIELISPDELGHVFPPAGVPLAWPLTLWH